MRRRARPCTDAELLNLIAGLRGTQRRAVRAADLGRNKRVEDAVVRPATDQLATHVGGLRGSRAAKPTIKGPSAESHRQQPRKTWSTTKAPPMILCPAPPHKPQEALKAALLAGTSVSQIKATTFETRRKRRSRSGRHEASWLRLTPLFTFPVNVSLLSLAFTSDAQRGPKALAPPKSTPSRRARRLHGLSLESVRAKNVFSVRKRFYRHGF